MNSFKGLIERLLTIKTTFQLNDSGLGKICGISHVAVGHILKGKAKGFDVGILLKIIEQLPVNPVWLLTGKGDMQLLQENLLKEVEEKYQAHLSAGTTEQVYITKEFLQEEIIKLQKSYIELMQENQHLTKKIFEWELKKKNK